MSAWSGLTVIQDGTTLKFPSSFSEQVTSTTPHVVHSKNPLSR